MAVGLAEYGKQGSGMCFEHNATVVYQDGSASAGDDFGQSRNDRATLCDRMTSFEWLTDQIGQRRVDVALVPMDQSARSRPMLVVSRTRAEDLQAVTRSCMADAWPDGPSSLLTDGH